MLETGKDILERYFTRVLRVKHGFVTLKRVPVVAGDDVDDGPSGRWRNPSGEDAESHFPHFGGDYFREAFGLPRRDVAFTAEPAVHGGIVDVEFLRHLQVR